MHRFTVASALGALMLLATTSAVAAPDARAAEPVPAPARHEAHRFWVGTLITPAASVASLGEGGPGTVFGLGVDAGYGLRPSRWFEVAVGASYDGYRGVHDADQGAHQLRAPLHLGLVLPFDDSEILLGVSAGWTYLWLDLPGRSSPDGGGEQVSAGAMGGYAGPRVVGAFAVRPGLDLYGEMRGSWAATWVQTEGVHIDSQLAMVASMSFAIGVRARL